MPSLHRSQNIVLPLGLSNTVTVVWQSGHCGIVGYEIADELLRLRSQAPLLGPEPMITTSVRSGIITERIKKEHGKVWTAYYED